MLLIRRIGSLRTLSFAVGVVLGLASAAYAQSGFDGHRRQPTAEEIDRRLGGPHSAASAHQWRDRDHEVQQLYDDIIRQSDPELRP